MSTEIDDLLTEASGEPTSTPDSDRLWARGRRRRWVRRASAVGGTAALVAAVAFAGIELTGPGTPDIAPMAPTATSEATDTADADAEAEAEAQRLAAEEARAAAEARAAEERAAARQLARERAEERLTRLEQEVAALEEEARARAELAALAAEEEREAAEEAAAASPSPDPARVGDPCAAHRGRDQEAFIDVVSPVNSQRVGATVTLVGCSNVYEATVSYRFVQRGAVLDEGFTTATCGSGCVGEFREELRVPAGTEPLELQVFWVDAADGRDRDLVSITFDREG
jgi:hypothetical protein